MEGHLNIWKSTDIINHINTTQDKKHMIIPIDTEKPFDKIQHPFKISLTQVRIERNFLNLIENIYNYIIYIILMVKKGKDAYGYHLPKAFSSEIGKNKKFKISKHWEYPRQSWERTNLEASQVFISKHITRLQ